MRKAGMRRIMRFTRIPVLLEFMEGCDDLIRRLDRVDALTCIRDVDGNTANLHLEPNDAALCAQQLLMLRFGYGNRVCGIAALKASQRAVAGAFFLDPALDDDVGRRPKACTLDRIE